MKVFRVEHHVDGHGPFCSPSAAYNGDRYHFRQPPSDTGDWPVLRPAPHLATAFRTHNEICEMLASREILYGFLSLAQLCNYFPNVHSAHHPAYHIVSYDVDRIVSDEWQCAFQRAGARRLEAIAFAELAQ